MVAFGRGEIGSKLVKLFQVENLQSLHESISWAWTEAGLNSQGVGYNQNSQQNLLISGHSRSLSWYIFPTESDSIARKDPESWDNFTLSSVCFYTQRTDNEWILSFLKEGHSPTLEMVQPLLHNLAMCCTFLSSEHFRNNFHSKDGVCLLYR